MTDRTRGLLLLLAAFVAGGLAGGALDRVYIIRMTMRRAQEERRGGADTRAVDRIPTPLEALDLTSEQQASLREIARKWRPQAGVALDEMRKKVSGMENDMFAEMLCVLTDAQRERYVHDLTENPFGRSVVDKRMSLVRAHACPAAPKRGSP